MLGAGLTVIVIVDNVKGQAPLFVMLHCKIFEPSPNPVTAVFGDKLFVIVPVPEIKDQVPMPEIGVLPDKVVEGFKMHNIWFGPALAIVGAWST